MDAEALNTFLTIHRERGFSKAAQALFRSQPAISRRIKLLEDDLGAPLFERVSGGVSLSQAGRVLLPYAERALAAIEDAKNAVRELERPNGGPITIAIVGTLASTDLTAILKQFSRKHPRAALSLATATSAQVSELVRRGEAVIGLRYHSDNSNDLNCHRLGSELLVVVCAAEHQFAGRSISSLAELRTQQWLAFPEVPDQPEASASHIFALFRTHGLDDLRWTRVDSLTAQKRLVEAGFGLALLPSSAVLEELRAGTLATVRVKNLKASNPIIAVTRRDGFLSAASRRLLELLKTRYTKNYVEH